MGICFLVSHLQFMIIETETDKARWLITESVWKFHRMKYIWHLQRNIKIFA